LDLVDKTERDRGVSSVKYGKMSIR
jgi:hypothetical protein